MKDDFKKEPKEKQIGEEEFDFRETVCSPEFPQGCVEQPEEKNVEPEKK